jgi:hypothetical protein
MVTCGQRQTCADPSQTIIRLSMGRSPTQRALDKLCEFSLALDALS